MEYKSDVKEESNKPRHETNTKPSELNKSTENQSEIDLEINETLGNELNSVLEKELETDISIVKDENENVFQSILTFHKDDFPQSESFPSVDPGPRYTAHPISMNVEDSDIKMVDISSLFRNNNEFTIAPDGYIPNSGIRLILKKPFKDCLPVKIEKKKIFYDDTKDILDLILLKYLPEDLMIEPASTMKTIQDIAKLAESKFTRIKPLVTLDDTEDLNRDLLNDIDADDDVSAISSTAFLKSSKYKRKKYARQITKAAIISQIAKKVKEREEKRKNEISDEAMELFQVEGEKESKKDNEEKTEVIDIDILDLLERRVRDESIIARKKEWEQMHIEAASETVNIDSLFRMLFKEFGEEKTFVLIYSASKNDENAMRSIDNVVKGRQNRLYVLNAATTNTYAFRYLSYNLGGEDILINIGFMMEDLLVEDKDKLENLQNQVTDILGNETKMVKFLSQLSWVLSCVNDKLKNLSKVSVPEMILSVFRKIPKDVEILKELVGGEERMISFLSLIRQCKDEEIVHFKLPQKEPLIDLLEKEKTEFVLKTSSEIDIYGDLTDEQKQLLPALPDDIETPSKDIVEDLVRALQTKIKKDVDERSSSLFSENTFVDEFDVQRPRLKSVHTDTFEEAQRAIKTAALGGVKKVAKYHKDIVKSELQHGKEGKELDAKDKESSKIFQITGFGIRQSTVDEEQVEQIAQYTLKMSDLLRNYYDRLLLKPWWPKNLNIEVSNNSIISALIKIFYGIEKGSYHDDVSQCIIEFRKLFPPSNAMKKEIIEKLYRYFKEDSKNTKNSIDMGSPESHGYYCKRVLNDLNVLRSLEENIEDLQNEFLHRLGEMKRQSQVKDKTEKDAKKKRDKDFDPEYIIQKIKEEVNDDFIPISDSRVTQLIKSLKTTVDKDEKIIISEAITKISKTRIIPSKLKEDIITETCVLFAELKNDLENILIKVESEENQRKIYDQLIKTTSLLNNLTKDSKDSSKEGFINKLPDLQELRETPGLLQSINQTFIDAEIKKHQDSLKESLKYEKESLSVKESLSLRESFGLKERKFGVDIKSKGKSDKSIITKTGAMKKEGVSKHKIPTSKDVKDLQPTVFGVKKHKGTEKRDEDKVTRLRIGKKDDYKNKSLLIDEKDGYKVRDLNINEKEIKDRDELQMEKGSDQEEKMTSELFDQIELTKQKQAADGTLEPLYIFTRVSKVEMNIETAVINEEDNLEEGVSGQVETYIVLSTSEKTEDQILEIETTVKPEELTSQKEEEDAKFKAEDTKSIITVLEEVRDIIAPKLSLEKQSILLNMINSLEMANNIEKMSPDEQQLITKMLTELFVVSKKDKNEIENLGKEILQHFIEKEPMTENAKHIIEDIYIHDLENLIVNLGEHQDSDVERKSDLLSRIKDLTDILQTINTENKSADKRIEEIIQKTTFIVTLEMNKSVVQIEKKPLVQKHKILNEPEVIPLIISPGEDKETVLMRQKITKILKDHYLTTKKDLSRPEKIVDDLILQRVDSVKDTEKMIHISRALLSIIQIVSSNDRKELMEIIASDALTNLIIDMQNLLTQSLKQFDVPITLIRCTANVLLLQNLGIFGLEDFEDELQKFKVKYPDEVNFAKNPLVLDLLSKDCEKLNLSKNELVIDNKLNFLRNVEALRPVDSARGVEMGLIVLSDEIEGIDALESILYPEIDESKNILPPMFKFDLQDEKELRHHYKTNMELKSNMMEIENLVKQHKIKRNMITSRKDSTDSFIEMVRDERHGSKSKLIELIKKNPALRTIANIGTALNLEIKTDFKSPFVGKSIPPIKPQLLNVVPRVELKSSFKFQEKRSDIEDGKGEETYRLNFNSPKSRKLSPLKHKKSPKHVSISVSADSTPKPMESKGRPILNETSYAKNKYSSMENLRFRIKKEICKEYPYLSDKINTDEFVDKNTDENVMSKSALEQTKEFQRLYGKNITVLPFIGTSSTNIGSILDQGLRALHFNLGPGILVRAIMEKERSLIKGTNKSKRGRYDFFPKNIDKKLFNKTGISKYLSNMQLQHCRMTNRPRCIPIHEWANVTVPGTYHNLRPDLFDTLHKTDHCPHSLLANKYLHRHGISIVKHIERYQLMDIINKSIQENAYVRIQNSLLKCLIRVLEDK